MSAFEPLLAAGAGMLTVLSPCVLPVLPIVLGGALARARWAPLALCLGMTVSFASAGTLLAVTAGWVAPFASGLRSFAILGLLAFGATALVPEFGARVFGALQLARFATPSKRGGILGAFLLGTQLGLVWSPCAGPILASILTLAAVHHDAAGAFVLLVSYGLGASVPMTALAYGGRRIAALVGPVRAHAERFHRLGGAAVAFAAIALLFGWDARVQDALAPYFPHLPNP